jgi:hypothetical protein
MNEMEEMEPTEAPEMEMDSDAKAKDDVLAELIEAMRGSLGEKLKPKASSMSISVIKKPKEEDEEV